VDVAPEVLQPNSVNGLTQLPAEDNKVSIGCANNVPPVTVIFTTGPVARNLNHIPLLFPPSAMQDGADIASVPVVTEELSLLFKQPLDDTVYAVEQSNPS
jgi:hypothetical protein